MTSPSTSPGADRFWHLGLTVPDLGAAMEELTRSLGLCWREVRTIEQAEGPLLVTLSEQGPPFFELVQGPAGSPWDAAAGPRIDHVGLWAETLADERERLEDAGVPVVIDGATRGMPANYHAFPASGLKVEVVDGAAREAITAKWGISGAAMDAHDRGNLVG